MRIIPRSFRRFYTWYTNVLSPPNLLGIRFDTLYPPSFLLAVAVFWLILTFVFTFSVVFTHFSMRPELQDLSKFLLIPALALYLGCAQLGCLFYAVILSARNLNRQFTRR